ncbi:MAG: VanW family protein [Bacillota bacterium]|nr:VanW family protein [Bacillota bacterium]
MAGLSAPPKKRTKLRRLLGKNFFTWKRYIAWRLPGRRFANTRLKEQLTYVAMEHSTPLFRRLRNVDMWLQHNKATNLRLAAGRLNGVLRPGETFSFWRLVGKPTAKKGYLPGMVLCEGAFYPGTGGGLCQLANLIYWLAIHTPLTVTERWRHNYDVFPDSDRTQPFGSGATVAYNYIDLQVRNMTNTAFQLQIWLDGEHLFGCWRCAEPQQYTYRVYEADHAITHEWWGGYLRHNVLRRKCFNANGNEVADEFLVENHAIMMYEPLLPEENI